MSCCFPCKSNSSVTIFHGILVLSFVSGPSWISCLKSYEIILKYPAYLTDTKNNNQVSGFVGKVAQNSSKGQVFGIHFYDDKILLLFLRCSFVSQGQHGNFKPEYRGYTTRCEKRHRNPSYSLSPASSQ